VAVAVFFTATLAPGMMPPDESATTPLKDDVAPPPCARAVRGESTSTSKAHASKPVARICMESSLGSAGLANEQKSNKASQ
jgi:hypothetical protein